ncbi:hypothetical protein [Synechococcus phage BUCT-ZZ01]|nr:hypothetical protein [Synechococcus phage BUCT-ZZ01]
MLSNINLATLNNKHAVSSTFILMAEISEESCREAIAWILEANMAEPENQPDALNLIICSGGGCVHSALALIDIMRGSSIPVRTIGLGQIASAGLFIFMAGQKGMRTLTENTSIMSHRFSSGMMGKSHELVSIQKEFTLTSERIINLYKKFTGMKEAEVKQFLLPAEDVWLTAKEALKYGLCDLIKDLK